MDNINTKIELIERTLQLGFRNSNNNLDDYIIIGGVNKRDHATHFDKCATLIKYKKFINFLRLDDTYIISKTSMMTKFINHTVHNSVIFDTEEETLNKHKEFITTFNELLSYQRPLFVGAYTQSTNIVMRIKIMTADELESEFKFLKGNWFARFKIIGAWVDTNLYIYDLALFIEVYKTAIELHYLGV